MKVCFVAPHANGLFYPETRLRFGGAEVHAYQFARGLAARGDHDVCFLVGNHGQSSPERREGISLHALADDRSWGERLAARLRQQVSRQPGFPGVRVNRWSLGLPFQLVAWSVWRIGSASRRLLTLRAHPRNPREHVLREINADVYCCFSVNRLTHEILTWCAQHSKPVLLLIMSDNDLAADYRPGSQSRNAYGEIHGQCHACLMQADQIVVQTARQKQLLHERFGREATLIPNPLDLQVAAPVVQVSPGERIALWIGKSDDVKRPELCLELAALLSDVRFVMIVNQDDPARLQRLRAHLPNNVELLESVSYHDMPAYYQRARVLLNTSRFEGLPYAFLEAGLYGVPVVSLDVDPDGLLTAHGCGICAHGSLKTMAQELHRLWTRDEDHVHFSREIREYVSAHHDARQRVADLVTVLSSLGSRCHQGARP